MPTVITTKELSDEQKRDPQLAHVRESKKLKTHRITLDDNELVVVERDGVLRAVHTRGPPSCHFRLGPQALAPERPSHSKANRA
ncbi:unnamed protein product [Trichogramma brassicae]|uniref:Uncharacterized protein n=1 Tax=Trichogramma brassicae TaxID=86971 RepID=A0A6H5IR84_9HYME|nr:unnamed protein product [Trichogramma brassicae]